MKVIILKYYQIHEKIKKKIKYQTICTDDSKKLIQIDEIPYCTRAFSFQSDQNLRKKVVPSIQSFTCMQGHFVSESTNRFIIFNILNGRKLSTILRERGPIKIKIKWSCFNISKHVILILILVPYIRTYITTSYYNILKKMLNVVTVFTLHRYS